jgi:phospholipase C
MIFAFSLIIGSINSVISLVISSNNINGINNTGIFSNNNTTTPIKHVVILFQENISFDHYSVTYPFATNPIGEPRFMADPRTPSVNGLLSEGLLATNLNSVNPFRLDRSQAVTCDMNHKYAA